MSEACYMVLLSSEGCSLYSLDFCHLSDAVSCAGHASMSVDCPVVSVYGLLANDWELAARFECGRCVIDYTERWRSHAN